jgi:predicted PurR-regulated permease PerM
MLFILSIVVAFWLLYALRSVLLPFFCGLVLAYLLLPIISWLEKKLPGQGKWLSTKRVSLIVFIFVVILAFVGLVAFSIITGVGSSFSAMLENAPQYMSGGLDTLKEWIRGFRQWFPLEMQEQVDKFIQDAGVALGNAVRGIFIRGLSFIPTTFGLILGFVSLPIFLFYILKDSERLSNGFYSAFSPQMAKYVKNVISAIDGVLGRWIRAQLVLGFTVACLCFIGLSILGIALAPALAVFAGIMEFIPILGPWIGGGVGVIVVLATAPEKVIWVALVYIIVQLLENTLLVPRIHGSYLRIHPAIVLVLLPLGAYIAGLWGMVLAVPLTATIVEIYKYMRLELEGVQQPSEQMN